MRVAVVHDWLPLFSGAEAVLAEIMAVLGPSDLYTLFDFLSDEDRRRIGSAQVTTSALARLPGVERYYRWTFPLCPRAVESFDLSAYDLVVSSSAAFAKGVIVHPQQKHVAYVHTPVRYAWDQTFEYQASTPLARFPFSLALGRAFHQLRIWDARTAHGPDLMIANSRIVARRIEQIYGRRALVVHPAVDVDAFPVCAEKDDYFVVAARLVPYKRIDLVVEAFARMPQHRLLVLGNGPQMSRLKALATPNIVFKGHVPRPELVEIIRRARAFVFASYEDFGIVMAEAQSAGTPVIAFRRGGAADIVAPLGASRPTGVLFDRQDVESLIAAVQLFAAHAGEITADACHENARRFAIAAFRAKFRAAIDWTMQHDGPRDAWPNGLEAALPEPALS